MNELDKLSLGIFPTPIHRLDNISRELGVEVYVKRDDMTGIGLGGNKVRKLEYLLAEAKAQGVDCFITGEVKHHHALDAVDAGMCILEAGHFETENPACEVMRNSLQNACDELKYNVTVFCSKGNPFGR